MAAIGHALFKRWDADREHFAVVALDGYSVPVAAVRISTGILTASLVHPREVFVHAITTRACSVVLLHNHPSGDPSPSPEDLEITRRLCTVGDLVGIRVADHVILGRDRHHSMAEHGQIGTAG